MDNMYSHDFDRIVNAASALQRPARVALAGADVENILLGLFDAQEAGFAEPIASTLNLAICLALVSIALRTSSDSYKAPFQE